MTYFQIRSARPHGSKESIIIIHYYNTLLRGTKAGAGCRYEIEQFAKMQKCAEILTGCRNLCEKHLKHAVGFATL